MSKWAMLVLLTLFAAATADAKNCRKGKPCGNSCIAAWKTCRLGGGGYREPERKQARKQNTAALQAEVNPPDPAPFSAAGSLWFAKKSAVLCPSFATAQRWAAAVRFKSEPVAKAMKAGGCRKIGKRFAKPLKLLDKHADSGWYFWEATTEDRELVVLAGQHLDKRAPEPSQAVGAPAVEAPATEPVPSLPSNPEQLPPPSAPPQDPKDAPAQGGSPSPTQ